MPAAGVDANPTSDEHAMPSNATEAAAEGDVGGEASGEHARQGDAFFVSKSAAAVLKHGILNRYLIPFVSKVGSTSTGHRVALLDGYAGPGRYEDDTPGSPALLAETARAVSKYRKVECHFVEQDRGNHRRLTAFLQEEGADLNAVPYFGRVEQHLDSIIASADGLPLFAYLDPFGFGVPFNDVVRLLQRNVVAGQPPTEVLLNFTANGIRRAGGLLAPGRRISVAEEKTLARGDTACGGAWWRDLIREHDLLEDAVDAIATAYMHRVCTRVGAAGFSIDVKKREHHKPVYFLIFFTRHPDGAWLFNQAVSGAQEDWRRILAPPPWVPNPDLLFDEPTAPSFEAEEKARASAWVRTIAANIERLLRDQGAFIIGDELERVYGGALGEARERHVREALKQLQVAGRISSDTKGDLQRKRVLPV